MIFDLFKIKQQIIEAGEIAAMGMVKIVYPAQDEVSYAEACRMVGDRRWVDFHERAGNLTPYRRHKGKNAKKYYSRMEISALKRAEAIRAEVKSLIKEAEEEKS